jgi:hypothetical protein
LTMTLGSLPSITATTLLVVPRSIPIIFPMAGSPKRGVDLALPLAI